MWVCVGVRGGGLEEYVFCCDNLYCEFYSIFDFFFFNPVCLFIIISLNAFDVALMFFFTFFIFFFFFSFFIFFFHNY